MLTMSLRECTKFIQYHRLEDVTYKTRFIAISMEEAKCMQAGMVQQLSSLASKLDETIKEFGGSCFVKLSR